MMKRRKRKGEMKVRMKRMGRQTRRRSGRSRKKA